jgi:UDP-N-acetylglucosamine/UDP-N-acetylgalactosamine diphosphorylase
MHMLNRTFIERLVGDSRCHLPYHVARKAIDCLALQGDAPVPTRIEGLKFEMFIFDALAYARRSVTMEVAREEEFAPVKNSSGADSPATARSALVSLHRRWLERALGAPLAGEPDVEISPLRALSEEDFVRSYRPDGPVTFPLYLA